MKKCLFSITLGIALVSLSFDAAASNPKNPETIHNPSLNSDNVSEIVLDSYRGRRRSKLRDPLSIGGALMTYRTGDYGRAYGLGALVEYAKENKKRKFKTSAFGFLNITAPSSLERTATASTHDDSSSTEVGVTFKQSVYQIGIGGKRNIIGQEGSAFSFYVTAGMGYTFSPRKTEFDSFDENIYQKPFDDDSEMANDFMFMLGLGIQVDAGFGKIYLAMDGYIPPNESNGDAYYSSLEGGGSYKLGVRIPIDM